MVEYKQQDNLIIAQDNYIEELSQKDKVRLLVISDSHGSKSIISNIIEKYGKDSDALCFCGDGLPDLLGIIEDSQYKKEIEENLPKAIVFVRGNGDNSSYNLLLNERIQITVPVDQTFIAANKKIFLSHGHKYNVYIGTKALQEEAEKNNAKIVFYGHTHVANAQLKTTKNSKEKIAILNPGSCSLPRGGMPHTFVIVDVYKENEKADYQYFEVKWDENGDVQFTPYTPPTGEVNLFW